MNLLIVPFHDWRKILIEGFRTRDAHFIEELNKKNDDIKIIINRPTTFLEVLLKRRRNLINGEILISKGNCKLYKISHNMYLTDYVSYDILGQVFNGYKWFIDKYGSAKYIGFITECLNHLEVKDNYYLLNQNILAYKISEGLNAEKKVFDAWDNFMKFDVYHKIKGHINIAYKCYSSISDFWITNSIDNVNDFQKLYSPQRLFLIKNGVDIVRFVENNKSYLPDDMKNIPRPIVGFGGKITHLIDTDLLNETMKLSPSVSFVFVGQILDKEVYDKIVKLENFYYLGDKHYDLYPNYVKNFDICTVPYVVKEEKKSGANTIKVYEYLATGKKVVGTRSNGLEDLEEYLFLADNPIEFAQEMRDTKNTKKNINVDEHSWKSKVDDLLKILINGN
ncbi:glycosyltransferase [Flavobacteriaceae bacterium KMM 6897]|nr:glycosyltransferase [Flavobacteriaceae bacterium KMM 6897]